MIERLHRLLLDVIKDEFDRQGGAELNSVQALLLYNMGDDELTAGELKTRGYYLGSNVSYNLKKLVDMGYLHYKRSDKDRRSVRVSLTPKGAGGARRRSRSSISASWARWKPSARSRSTTSRASTSRWCAWSASGPTRSATASRPLGGLARRHAVLRRSTPHDRLARRLETDSSRCHVRRCRRRR